MKKYIIAFILLFSIFFILDVFDYVGLYLIGGSVYGGIYHITKGFIENKIEQLSIFIGIVIFLILNVILTFKLHKIVKYCIFIVLFSLSYFVDFIVMMIEIDNKTMFFSITITIKSLLLVCSLYLISLKR